MLRAAQIVDQLPVEAALRAGPMNHSFVAAFVLHVCEGDMEFFKLVQRSRGGERDATRQLCGMIADRVRASQDPTPGRVGAPRSHGDEAAAMLGNPGE